MILAAHQPQYLPWLGYFDKLDRADLFVLLDDVQFKKNEWQNRNRIPNGTGWAYLTVPVRHRFPQAIHEVAIAGQGWQKAHRRTLEQTYAKSPFIGVEQPLLDLLYTRTWNFLVDLNVCCVERLAKRFDIRTPIHRSSEDPSLPAHPDHRLIALCKLYGADTYLAGPGGRSYMDLSLWEKAGISVVFQSFHHPVYPQGKGTFLPGMCALDLLFRLGGEGFSLVRETREKAA